MSTDSHSLCCLCSKEKDVSKDMLDEENRFLLQNSSLGTAVYYRIWRAALTLCKVCSCEHRQYRVKKFYAEHWGLFIPSLTVCVLAVQISLHYGLGCHLPWHCTCSKEIYSFSQRVNLNIGNL